MKEKPRTVVDGVVIPLTVEEVAERRQDQIDYINRDVEDKMDSEDGRIKECGYRKYVTLMKRDNGSIEMLSDNCTIDEFNEGGGVVIVNTPSHKDGELTFFIRALDGCSSPDSVHNMVMNVKSESEVDLVISAIGDAVRSFCRKRFAAPNFTWDKDLFKKEGGKEKA